MFERYTHRADSNEYVNRADGEPTAAAEKKSRGQGVSRKRMNKTINDAIANLVKSQLPNAIKAVVEPLFNELKPKQKVDAEGKPIVEDTTSFQDLKGLSPEANAAMKRLNDTNAELQKQLRGMTDENKTERAARQKAELDGAIDGALNEYTFTSPSARESARKLIAMDVKRTDDGKIVAGDLPLADYVKESLTKTHDYFLATAEVGGAGAQKGVTRNSAGVGLETIKKDMTDAERVAVAQEISRAVSAAQMI